MPNHSDAVAFRKLLVRNVTLPLLLGVASSAIFVVLIFYQISLSKMVNHTNVVLARTNRLQKLMIDGETGLRGYVITANNSFLEPFIDATNVVS